MRNNREGNNAVLLCPHRVVLCCQPAIGGCLLNGRKDDTVHALRLEWALYNSALRDTQGSELSCKAEGAHAELRSPRVPIKLGPLISKDAREGVQEANCINIEQVIVLKADCQALCSCLGSSALHQCSPPPHSGAHSEQHRSNTEVTGHVA